MARTNDPPLSVPLSYPTAAIFIDESGSRASANEFFVVAAVKVRQPGELAREIHAVRERYDFRDEFKFAEVNKSSLSMYAEIIRVLVDSDATLAACVVSAAVCDPFRGREDTWRVHAEIAAQLLVGCINRRELVGVHLDAYSTPVGRSVEDTVRNLVNQRLKNTSIISAVSLDSRSNDLLQVADMVAGAIRYERTQAQSTSTARSPKGKVAQRLATSFHHPGLADGRDARMNIATYRGSRAGRNLLRAVPSRRVSNRRRAG